MQMRTESNSEVVIKRSIAADFVVVGGGLSGLCAAVAAARHGTKTLLVQDRPMLGGNASSECRMGIMGAHGDNCKETGLLEEVQLDNIYANPLMRYTLWDDALLSLALAEPNLTLLLNTSVREVHTDGNHITGITAWNTNEYCEYAISGTLFADCSGDGILRLSGADFRIGRESPKEFNETYQQVGDDHRTMGNSILLQLRKCTEHRPFIAPSWAYHFTDEDFPQPSEDEKAQCKRDRIIKSYKRPWPENNNFWWIEYGGNIDTIGDAGAIQRELKKVAYGVWEYMKNHPDGRCRDYELDWIGHLPGKRESTRFMGDYILTQDDIMAGGKFPDTVCYGGWTLDDHHPDAFFHPSFVSIQHTPPSPFGIPYRCLYSRNIDNLMFAGRDISCSHLGMSATRVMATCALLGQAVGTAAAVAVKYGETPRGVGQRHLEELQSTLEDDDVMLPGRWRQISPLTAAAHTDYAVLKNGIDRNWQQDDNGVWLQPGEAIEYTWETPQNISGARFIFDTELSFQGKRMRKLEATTEYHPMPPMLTKAFHIDAWRDGAWQTVFTQPLVTHRLVRCTFPSVTTDRLRFVPDTVWGESQAHIFAFDIL